MTDSERLKLVLNHLKLTVAKLAKELGYGKPQKIYNVTQGLNGISAELARDITEKYREISYEWLKEGRGKMLIDNPSSSSSEQTIQVSSVDDYVKIPREVLDMIRSLTETVQSQQRTIELLEQQRKKTNVPPEAMPDVPLRDSWKSQKVFMVTERLKLMRWGAVVPSIGFFVLILFFLSCGKTQDDKFPESIDLTVTLIRHYGSFR